MPQIDENILELSEQECAQRLAPMWNDADLHSFYPAETRDVCELLRVGGELDVDLGLLEGWARSGQVGKVAIRAGRFAWNPSQILRAAALCNASRRWIPMSSKHVHKMTAVELSEQQAAAVGQSIFTDIDSVDCRSLIGVISNSQDPELRSVLCVALQTKLKAAGIQ